LEKEFGRDGLDSWDPDGSDHGPVERGLAVFESVLVEAAGGDRGDLGVPERDSGDVHENDLVGFENGYEGSGRGSEELEGHDRDPNLDGNLGYNSRGAAGERYPGVLADPWAWSGSIVAIADEGDVDAASSQEMAVQHLDLCSWSWGPDGIYTWPSSSSWYSGRRRETRDRTPASPCDTAHTPAACHCDGEEAWRR
jgi:hypothetical protein